ncbi:BBE domain-containing protein, partial [Calidithermus terrae]|uniref:BBE domain-containing protein n=1 Tax=Calidithermus terrae TaxID=1408545 RepID=UPI0011C3A55A
ADPRLTSVLKLYGPRHARPGPVTSTGQFVGPLDELRRVLEPFLRRVPPHQLRLERKAFLEAVNFFGGDPEPDWSVHFHGDHKKFKNTSAFAYGPLPPEALQTLCAWMEKAPTGEDLVQLENFGGKVADLAPHATAFFHRRAQFFLQYQAYWSDDSAAEDHLSWVRGVRDALTPYTRGAYVNYTDADLEDWPERYYGENYPRLQEVKQQYDPEDFFRFPQSVRLPGVVDGQ